MKGSIVAAKYGIRKIDHGAGGAGAIGSAGVQKGVTKIEMKLEHGVQL